MKTHKPSIPSTSHAEDVLAAAKRCHQPLPPAAACASSKPATQQLCCEDEDANSDDAASSPTTEGSEADSDSAFEVTFRDVDDYGLASSDGIVDELEMGKKTAHRVDHATSVGQRNATGAKPTISQPEQAWTSTLIKYDSNLTPRGTNKRNLEGKSPTLLSALRIPQPAEEPDTDAVSVAIPEVMTPTRMTQANAKAIKMMEHSPLLRPMDSIANDPDWEFRYAVEDRPDVKTEFLKLCELSYPVIFTYVLEFLPGIISMTLVGHMNSPLTKEYVDGVSMSTMFVNLTVVAFGFGLATALDTLCSQAYGAGKPLKMGVYLQSGFIVLAGAFVPVFLLNWFTEDLLLLMGQPAEVSRLAGRFSRLILPGVPFLYIYELVKKVLQAQNVVKPMVYIAIFSNFVNVVVGVYLTFYTSWGFDGAAIARIVANVALPACLVPFFCSNPEIVNEWWPGWKLGAAINHIRPFLVLGLPGMLMMLLEWWSFEIMAAFVGLLPDSIVAISVHSVLVNVSTFAFNFFLGISVAGNIRVGNCVGSNQPEHAKMASYLSMALSLGVCLALAIIITLTRSILPHVFINDPTTIALAASALLYLLPFQFMDAWNGVMQGVFRGTGRQMLGAYINFLAYFIVGLPFGIYLAFQCHLGVEGMWLGLTAGISIGCAVSIFKIYNTDWEAMADSARLRTA
ncbi:TPA: hypothetical protein N0F65_009657 [Lagenidium giganteum]|uniref:Uncharacterized protein n=1 Tax=Lagenidium giganteum TaxID=4803 RepID=A0AAV2YC19_9STRA|nr:TPA: hypothetical protein N0F65_009657 [Lagenidium giganteum]